MFFFSFDYFYCRNRMLLNLLQQLDFSFFFLLHFYFSLLVPLTISNLHDCHGRELKKDWRLLLSATQQHIATTHNIHFLFFSEDMGDGLVKWGKWEKNKSFFFSSPIAVLRHCFVLFLNNACLLPSLIVRKTAVYVVYFMVGQDLFFFYFSY